MKNFPNWFAFALYFSFVNANVNMTGKQTILSVLSPTGKTDSGLQPLKSITLHGDGGVNITGGQIVESGWNSMSK